MKLHFSASFDFRGDEVELIAMQEGEISGRGQYIGAEALQASLPAFERVWLQNLILASGEQNHLEGAARAVFPQGVIMGNVVGVADYPRIETIDGKAAIVQRGAIADAPLKALLTLAAQKGKLSDIGLSINGEAEPQHLRPMQKDGRTLTEITQIDTIHSIDFVAHPGAGGRLRALLASLNPQQGDAMFISQLTKFLDAKGIAYTNDPSPLNVIASAQVQASADIDSLLKAIAASLKAGLDTVAEKLLALAEKDAPAEKEAEQQEEPKESVAASTPEPAHKEIPMQDDKLKEFDLRLSKLRVADVLASEPGLNSAVKTLIASKFDGQIVAEDAVKQEIEYQKKVLSLTSDAGKPKTFGTGVIVQASDKPNIALHKLLGVIPDDSEKDAWSRVPAFRDIRSAYHHYTGDGETVSGRLLATEYPYKSTDFPYALGDSIHRRLLQEYRQSAFPIERFATISSVSDFLTNYASQIGGLGDLDAIAEDDDWHDYEWTVTTETQASYSVSTYGKMLVVTRRFIKNNRIGVLERAVSKVRRAAVRSLKKFFFDLLLNYSGSINGGTIYDSKALYHADHANVQALALNATNLWALRNLISAQTELASSEPLDLEGKFLFIPKELEKAAYIALVSQSEPGDLVNDANILREKFGWENVIVVDKAYLRGDADNYYMSVDPKEYETLEIGFMDGQREPEIILQNGPTEGNTFDQDRWEYKVRHEYGGCVVDYRGLAASIL